MNRNQYVELGKKIYKNSLSGRKGFDLDIEADIWEEIYEDIGRQAEKFYKETEGFHVVVQDLMVSPDDSKRLDKEGMEVLKQKIADWIEVHQPDTRATRILGVFRSRGYHSKDIQISIQLLLETGEITLGPNLQPVTPKFMYGAQKWYKEKFG